jgi:uncharacterized protein (TIGR01777 family)
MKVPRIILAGGSGFLGNLLSRHFAGAGWEVVVLTRRSGRFMHQVREVAWDGETIGGWTHELEGATALVNLAGRSVNCRYHKRNRRLMLDSRINSTRALGEAIGRCKKPPAVWLNSSTATIYKHTFGSTWDESGEIGGTREAKDEFSVEVAMAWERVFNEATTPNTRKIAMRSAMVLGHGPNSVFPVFCTLVRCGLGGPIAGGKQFVSWIHELDYCRAVEWLIAREQFSGVANLASPNPITNKELPFGCPLPRWMLEIGAFLLRTETELIIKSRRVTSSRLSQTGFQFHFPTFRSAVDDLVNNSK